MARKASFESDVSAEDLRIDKHKLDTEIIRHPELYLRAANAHVEAVSRADLLRREVDETRADVDSRVRRGFEKKEVKSTEKMITAAVEGHKDYKKAYSDYLDAKLEADRAAGLKEAFHRRGYMLRDLVSLWVAGYYSDASIRGAASGVLSEDDVQDSRRRISLKRQRLRDGRETQ